MVEFTDAQKLEKVRGLIKDWDTKPGHDACWYYPEIFEAIAEVVGVELENLPTITKEEFKEGCTRFQEELYEQN